MVTAFWILCFPFTGEALVEYNELNEFDRVDEGRRTSFRRHIHKQEQLFQVSFRADRKANQLAADREAQLRELVKHMRRLNVVFAYESKLLSQILKDSSCYSETTAVN